MKKYKYTLEEDYVYFSGIKNRKFEGEDKTKRIWLRILPNGAIFIPKGYSWDGATLAPDFPELYYPTLVHDALYQFLPHTPMSRKEIDDIFLKMMQEENFKYAKIYYRAVRWFGGIFVKLTR